MLECAMDVFGNVIQFRTLKSRQICIVDSVSLSLNHVHILESMVDCFIGAKMGAGNQTFPPIFAKAKGPSF